MLLIVKFYQRTNEFLLYVMTSLFVDTPPPIVNSLDYPLPPSQWLSFLNDPYRNDESLLAYINILKLLAF